MKKRGRTILIRFFLLFGTLSACMTLFPSLGWRAEWLTIAIIPYLFLGVLVVLAIVGLRPAAQRKRITHFRAKHGLCIGCGYDLRGHGPGQQCPECGSPIPSRPDIIDQIRSSP